MLTTELLTRSFGLTSSTSTAPAQIHRQLLALQPAPRIRYDGQEANNATTPSRAIAEQDEDYDRTPGARDGQDGCFAHKAGVNALAIDRFEGR